VRTQLTLEKETANAIPVKDLKDMTIVLSPQISITKQLGPVDIWISTPIFPFHPKEIRLHLCYIIGREKNSSRCGKHYPGLFNF
jgi:hypothetical protein